VACATLGTNFVGIELDEGYLEDAVARVRAVLERPEPQRKAAGRV
jgi:DNA modification methylase